MFLIRYFVVVGACLLAIILAANKAVQQKPADSVGIESTASIDKTTIRISATRAFEPPVVIDTQLPTIEPATSATVAQGTDLTTRVREAHAEANAGDLDKMGKNAPKLEPVKATPKKRKVAVRRKSPDVRSRGIPPQDERLPPSGSPLFAGFPGDG